MNRQVPTLPSCAWCGKPFHRTDIFTRFRPKGIAVRKKGCLTCSKICARRRSYFKMIERDKIARIIKKRLARNTIGASGGKPKRR